MKKTIIATLVLGTFLVSCSSGNKAETGEAQEVEQTTEAESVKYSTIDESSKLDWRAAHLGGTAPRFGKIWLKTAEVTTLENEVKNATVTFDMNSLSVENFEEGDEKKGKLTGHLLSADFFNTEVHPVSTFELTNVVAAEGEFNSIVTGNLTILDATKSITFNANINVTEDAVSIKSDDFILDRSNWGLVYNAEGTAGVSADRLISDDMGFTIDVTIKK